MFDWYPHYENYLARLQLVLFMLALGATLPVGEFVRVLRHPRSLLVGLGVHIFVLPFLAVLLNHALSLPPETAVGLVLMSAMPGGGLSKVFAYLGKGNLPLSITLTAVTTLLAMATVPLWLRLLATEYVPPDFQMPMVQIVVDVVGYLLLPLGLALLLGRLLSSRPRQLFSKICLRLGFLAVLVMVVCAAGAGRVRPGDYGWRTPLAIILFCFLSQQLGMLPFHLLRWPRPDRMAVGIEVTMRNMNLALFLNTLLFPASDDHLQILANGVLFVILFYASAAMVIGLIVLFVHRWLARRGARH